MVRYDTRRTRRASRAAWRALLAGAMAGLVGSAASTAPGQGAAPTGSPAVGASSQPTGPEDLDTAVPSAEEILRQLMKERPAQVPIPPSEPGQPTEPAELPPTPLPGRPAPEQPLRPEGSMLVDRAGRLVREGTWWTFVFESNRTRTDERPLRLLPNQMLETMEIASAGGTRSVIFVVSGEITEYHGMNYLLLRKVLVRRDLGNLQ